MSLFDIRKSYRSGAISKQQYIEDMHLLHRQLFDYADFIGDTDIARIEITDDGTVMTTRAAGIKLLCNSTDKRLVPVETLNFSSYESAELEMVHRFIQPGFTVFDVGANIGWYSLNIAKAFPEVRVMAFEPIPNTFGYLHKNVILNGIENVHIHNFGFSNEEKEMSFYSCPDSSGSASAANIGKRPDAQVVKCFVKTLDSFTDGLDTTIDFLKCDVEGAELFVFKGATQCLAEHKPVILSEMLRKWSAEFGYSPNDIIRLLSSIGYKCFTIYGTHLVELYKVTDETVETNFFFLHPAKHAAYIQALVVEH